MMATLQADYIVSLPEKIGLLKTYKANKNWVEAKSIFHKIKGTGSTYGIPELSQLGEVMEKLCQLGGPRLEARIQTGIELMIQIHLTRSADIKHAYPLENLAPFKDLITAIT